MRFFTPVFLFFFFGLLFPILAQTTIYHENFSGTVTGILINNNGWRITNATPSTYSQASGGNYLVSASSLLIPTTYTFTLDNKISTQGYKNIKVSWGGMKNDDNGDVSFEFSTDGGTSYAPVTGWTPVVQSWALVNEGNPIPLPVAAEDAANIRFRWSYTSAIMGWNSSFYGIDDILITGEPMEGISTFSWQSRPVGEDPFIVSSPTAANPYAQDNLIMRWTKTVHSGVNLTEAVVSNSHFQSLNSLALVQSGATTTTGTILDLALNYPVSDFALTLLDVDRNAGQFQDQVVIQGFLNGSPVVLSKNKVQTTSFNQFDATQSRIQGNPSGTVADNATQEGNVKITFPSKVDHVNITYTNSDAGEQDIAIGDLSWRTVGPDFFLPVSLVRFTGSYKHFTTYLNWKTASEENNAHFEVQRSQNGHEFTKIGKVNGHGTTIQPHSYSFEDQHPFAGITYYRLKQVDFDGKVEFSAIIAVKQDQVNSNVELYPNPASDLITIHLPAPLETFRIYITDLAGKTAKVWVVSGGQQRVSLSLSDVKSGIYIMNILEPGFITSYTSHKILKK